MMFQITLDTIDEAISTVEEMIKLAKEDTIILYRMERQQVIPRINSEIRNLQDVLAQLKQIKQSLLNELGGK